MTPKSKSIELLAGSKKKKRTVTTSDGPSVEQDVGKLLKKSKTAYSWKIKLKRNCNPTFGILHPALVDFPEVGDSSRDSVSNKDVVIRATLSRKSKKVRVSIDEPDKSEQTVFDGQVRNLEGLCVPVYLNVRNEEGRKPKKTVSFVLNDDPAPLSKRQAGTTFAQGESAAQVSSRPAPCIPHVCQVVYDATRDALRLTRNPLRVMLVRVPPEQYNKPNTNGELTPKSKATKGGGFNDEDIFIPISMHISEENAVLSKEHTMSCKGRFVGATPYDSWHKNLEPNLSFDRQNSSKSGSKPRKSKKEEDPLDAYSIVTRMVYSWEIFWGPGVEQQICLVELAHTQQTQSIRLDVDGKCVLKDCVLLPNVWKGVEFVVGGDHMFQSPDKSFAEGSKRHQPSRARCVERYKVLMRYDVDASDSNTNSMAGALSTTGPVSFQEMDTVSVCDTPRCLSICNTPKCFPDSQRDTEQFTLMTPRIPEEDESTPSKRPAPIDKKSSTGKKPSAKNQECTSKNKENIGTPNVNRRTDVTTPNMKTPQPHMRTPQPHMKTPQRSSALPNNASHVKNSADTTDSRTKCPLATVENILTSNGLKAVGVTPGVNNDGTTTGPATGVKKSFLSSMKSVIPGSMLRSRKSSLVDSSAGSPQKQRRSSAPDMTDGNGYGLSLNFDSAPDIKASSASNTDHISGADPRPVGHRSVDRRSIDPADRGSTLLNSRRSFHSTVSDRRSFQEDTSNSRSCQEGGGHRRIFQEGNHRRSFQDSTTGSMKSSFALKASIKGSNIGGLSRLSEGTNENSQNSSGDQNAAAMTGMSTASSAMAPKMTGMSTVTGALPPLTGCPSTQREDPNYKTPICEDEDAFVDHLAGRNRKRDRVRRCFARVCGAGG